MLVLADLHLYAGPRGGGDHRLKLHILEKKIKNENSEINSKKMAQTVPYCHLFIFKDNF